MFIKIPFFFFNSLCVNPWIVCYQESLPQNEGLHSRQAVYFRSIHLLSYSLDWGSSSREWIHFTKTNLLLQTKGINCRKLSEQRSVNLLWHIKCSTYILFSVQITFQGHSFLFRLCIFPLLVYNFALCCGVLGVNLRNKLVLFQFEKTDKFKVLLLLLYSLRCQISDKFPSFKSLSI